MLLITSANITDRNGAIEMLSYYSAKSDRLIRLQKILVDGGYSGEEFADAVWAICGAEVEVAKETNYTNLLLSKNDGQQNALLDGWINADAFGKIVKG